MVNRHLLVTCVFSLLLIAPAMADVTDSGTTKFKEQAVLHKVTGNTSASATASFSSGIYKLSATVDGVKHEVRATNQRLKWNDKRLQLDGFQKIEIVIGPNDVRIDVDGTQVLPEKPAAPQKQVTPGKPVSPGKNADTRPNILFIIADDASRDSMGVFGSQYIKTPGFDSIAKKGVVFTQAYSCNPKCAPARACLLTGRYSWQLEEACNHNPTLSAKWSFYPYLLEDAGYFVGFTGKGWSPGTWAVTEADGTAAEKNPAGYAFNKLKKRPPYKGIGPNDYAANFDAFLSAKPESTPFCFWLGTKEPHRGYGKDNWKLDGRDLADVTVPDYFPDNETIRGDLADYAIEVEWFDHHIERAIEYLKKHGQLENTLIIATSDHGMPFPRVKGQIYEDGYRVPFVARWDAVIKPGRTVTDFITFPDLAPTLMELTGTKLHPQMTGASFAAQLRSEKSGRIDPLRNYTLLGKERHDIGRTDAEQLSVGYPVRAIRNDQFLYARNFKPHRWPVGDPQYDFSNCDGSPSKKYLMSLTPESDDYRFFELAFGKRPEEELYDVVKDPGCTRNLANDPRMAATKEALWKQLESALIEQEDPRILGEGDIFDFYPNCKIERQQKIYVRPDWDPVKIFKERYGSDKSN